MCDWDVQLFFVNGLASGTLFPNTSLRMLKIRSEIWNFVKLYQINAKYGIFIRSDSNYTNLSKRGHICDSWFYYIFSRSKFQYIKIRGVTIIYECTVYFLFLNPRFVLSATILARLTTLRYRQTGLCSGIRDVKFGTEFG